MANDYDAPVFNEMAKSSTPAPPVSMALDALGKAIDVLAQMVDRMEHKLSPVMAPERSTPTNSDEQDSSEQSTITSAITSNVDIINRLTRIAEGYLNRLEI